MSEIDRVLEILEGNDHQHTHNPDGDWTGARVWDDECWRCGHHAPVTGAGLCEGCRAWMAAETDDDPAAAAGNGGLVALCCPVCGLGWFGEGDEAECAGIYGDGTDHEPTAMVVVEVEESPVAVHTWAIQRRRLDGGQPAPAAARVRLRWSFSTEECERLLSHSVLRRPRGG